MEDREIIKNNQHIAIVKICASCVDCVSNVSVDAEGKYRACLLMGRFTKRVLPTDVCDHWQMCEKFANFKIEKERLGHVKRKEYLDFVLWANTGDDVPREIKAIVTAKNSIELLRAFWESENNKSIYLHIN